MTLLPGASASVLIGPRHAFFPGITSFDFVPSEVGRNEREVDSTFFSFLTVSGVATAKSFVTPTIGSLPVEWFRLDWSPIFGDFLGGEDFISWALERGIERFEELSVSSELLTAPICLLRISLDFDLAPPSK